MHEIKVNRRIYKVASSWNELTPKQYMRIMQLESLVMVTQAKQLRILFVLLNIRWWHFAKMKDLLLLNLPSFRLNGRAVVDGLALMVLPLLPLSFQMKVGNRRAERKAEREGRSLLKAELWLELCKLADFMNEPVDVDHWLVSDTRAWWLRLFDVVWKRFNPKLYKDLGKPHMMIDGINRWSIREFASVEVDYERFGNTKRPEYLASMWQEIVGARYRAKPNLLDDRIDYRLIALKANYDSLRIKKLERYPKVFNKSGSGQQMPDKWLRVIVNLAGEKFGTVEAAQNALIDSVFMSWQINAEDYEKAKARA